MDHKAFILQLEVFKINSSNGFHLPSHHLLTLVFCLVIPSKRLGFAWCLLSHRNSDGIDLGLKLTFGDIQLVEKTASLSASFGVFVEYLYL